jgi:predicted nucleic acid-binding protein
LAATLLTTYLPDTNVLIDVLNGKRGSRELLNRLVTEGHELSCCAVTVAEVHSGIHPKDSAKVERFLSALRWYDVTRAVALRAGQIRYAEARQGVTLSLPDTLIAALALEHGLTLITNNRKHFTVPGLLLHPQPL